ncbi:MAG: hypothetical protein ACXWWL_07720 [Candidatus Limnocylindria bacterium]
MAEGPRARHRVRRRGCTSCCSAPHGELVAALELACRVGKIARTLTWHRAIGAAGPDEVEERWITAPVESMVSLLDDSHLGRA